MKKITSLVLALILTLPLMLAIPVASAEFGDEVPTFSFTPAPAGNGRAVAYDGTDLYYTYYGSNSIYHVSTNNISLGQYNTGVQLGALSWDPSRGKLWAGAYDGTGIVYLVDYGVSITYQFTFTGDAAHFPGHIDGLAYDASDDTLWMSEDWGHVVYHVDTDGTVLGSWTIDLGDGAPLDNSGLEVVCGTYLFLGHPSDTTHGPAANEIYVFLKDGTYTGMSIDCGDNLVEGLAFGDYVIWANNAATNKLVAYDILDDLCRWICPIEVEKHFTYTDVEFTPYEVFTYTETLEHPTGYFLNHSDYKLDAPWYRWWDEDWSWTHTFDPTDKVILSATLNISAFDVDPTEIDTISADGTYLGDLTGSTEMWSNTVLAITNLNDLLDGTLVVDIDIDSTHSYDYWAVTLNNCTLTVEYVAPPAELGTPLDEVEMVIRGGKVRSTNPGQLYAVITITDPIEDFYFYDVFDVEFDVNPAHLGGGVEIIMVDPDGYATVLTDEPGNWALVDNDLNYVVGYVDLDEPIPPGYSLMIYIKFQTSMKKQPYTGDDAFRNWICIYAPDIPATAVQTSVLPIVEQ